MSPPKHDKHALLAFLALPQVSNEAREIAAVQPPQPSGGPGDLVKIILDNIGIKPTRNCGCEAMRRRMNAWGFAGCWAHRREMFDWFAAKATEAGIKVSVFSVGRVIRQHFRQRPQKSTKGMP